MPDCNTGINTGTGSRGHASTCTYTCTLQHTYSEYRYSSTRVPVLRVPVHDMTCRVDTGIAIPVPGTGSMLHVYVYCTRVRTRVHSVSIPVHVDSSIYYNIATGILEDTAACVHVCCNNIYCIFIFSILQYRYMCTCTRVPLEYTVYRYVPVHVYIIAILHYTCIPTHGFLATSRQSATNRLDDIIAILL